MLFNIKLINNSEIEVNFADRDLISMICRHHHFPHFMLYTILVYVWCFMPSAFADNDSIPTFAHHNPVILRCDHNYPPFEYIDNQGHPKGFVVDMFQEVMKKLQLPYKIEFSEWKDIPDLILQGKIDLTDMVYTNERAKKFKFGPIWCYSNLALVVRKDNTHLHIFSQLKDKAVAVENKSLSHTMLHEAGYDKNIVADDKLENAIIKLSKGNYDAVMCDRPTGMFFIKEKGINNLEVIDLDIAPHEYCLVGNDEKLLDNIDYALSELKKDGTYDKLYNKWFVDKSIHISRIFYITLGILLITTAILFIFIKLLCKQVNKSKRLLEEKNKRIAIAIHAGNVNVWGYNVKKKHFYNIEGDIFPPEGKSFEEVLQSIHPDDRHKFEELFFHTIFEKDNIQSYTFRIDRKHTNEYRYYEKEFAITSSKKEEIDVVIGTSKDVTNDINKQHKLEEEREKALQADKIKSAFLANMSHEIRTPLNAIVGFSNLLQYTDAPEERKEYAKLINDNNDLLLHLINDILELSKIESGIIEIQEEEFDLAQFFNNTAASFKERNNNPEVQILCDNPYKHCLVRTDRNRLAQVLNNFTSNAVKHTPKGYIKIGYSFVDSGIRIYVEDTGNGIPDDKQHLIFERFEKLNNFAQGTGLGLSINKAIMEAMGGKIGFSSEEGKGSIFWAWNKCDVNITEHDNVDNSNCTIHKNSNDNRFMKRGDKVSILVAEDNESNFLLVKAILRDYEITQAANGQEAINLVSSQPFDLILMDIQMPIMDGLEATRKIREFNKTIPIIALTAYAFNTDRKRSEEVGCNDFITKPLKKSELLEIINKYI